MNSVTLAWLVILCLVSAPRTALAMETVSTASACVNPATSPTIALSSQLCLHAATTALPMAHAFSGVAIVIPVMVVRIAPSSPRPALAIALVTVCALLHRLPVEKDTCAPVSQVLQEKTAL